MAFLLGVFIGAIAGVVIISLCVTAKNNDESTDDSIDIE